MTQPSRAFVVLFLVSLLAATHLAAAARQEPQHHQLSSESVARRKHKHPYTAPSGFFIQVCGKAACVLLLHCDTLSHLRHA